VYVLPVPADDDYLVRPRRSICVWALVVVNSAVFVSVVRDPRLAISQYGFEPAAWSARRALSSMFVHAGLLHILGNMFFLVAFGRKVENILGTVKFLAAYLLAGVAAASVYGVTSAQPLMPMVGASGAISGVVGMYLALLPNAPVDLEVFVLSIIEPVKTIRSTGVVATGLWFVEQLVLALLTAATGLFIGIAFWAHVGGFVAGVALGVLLGRIEIG
jgi:membrane associated rhomboid family serine protease